MKIRILMLSLLGLMFFNSCSSDSNSSDSNSSNSTSQNLDPNTILPKKVIVSGVNAGPFDQEGYTYEFFFNQNKIDYLKLTQTNTNSGNSIVSNFYFTYNGNLITSISDRTSTYNFIYQNNQLIQTNINYGQFIEDPITYTYNSNGTVTCINGSLTTTYTLTNGVVTSDSSGNEFNYLYNSYSPFKNIIGIDKITLFPNNLGLLQYLLFFYPKNIESEPQGEPRSSSNGYQKYIYTFNNILFPVSFFVYKYGKFVPNISLSFNIIYY